MSDKEKSLRDEVNDLPGTIPMMGAAPTPIDPMKQPLWEIDERFLNPFAELPPVQTWCKMGERRAIPKSGVITFSAKPKQGKSLSTSALIIPILTGEPFDTVTPTEERPRLVVVFDTEMDTPTLTDRAKKMQKALGDQGKRFVIVPLLPIPYNQRREIIDEVTERYNPDIVVIDVVTRLISNFNDVTESVEIGNWLMRYAAQRTVLTVIHQNKAADNTQMKGHLGSQMEELAVENYTVKHDKGVYIITPTNARQSHVDENSTVVTFALNDDGEIITATDIMRQQRETEAEGWRKNFRLIFGEDETLKHSEMVKRIMSQEGLGETAAKTKIVKAAEAGAIAKTDPTNNRSPYYITSPNSAASDFDGLDTDEDDL